MYGLKEYKDARGKLSHTQSKISELFAKKDESGNLAWTKEDGEVFACLQEKAKDEQAELKKWEPIAKAHDENVRELEYLSRASSAAPFDGNAHESKGQAARPRSFYEVLSANPAFKSAAATKFASGFSLEIPGFSTYDLKYDGGRGVETKATVTTASGFAPFSLRTGDVVPFAARIPLIADLMPQIVTDQNAVVYMEETTQTRAAAATAEGSTLPESTRVWTQRTVNIEDVGTTLPVTERELDDVPALMQVLDATLGLEAALAEETQLLTGTGTSPQLRGFLSTAAATAGVQTQAVSTDDAITAIQKAMTNVMATGFANPSAVVVHPTNWQNIITLKDTTGRFIFGDPSQAGPRTLWGLPAIVTTAMTLNSALTGDFGLYARVYRRRNTMIEVGWQNTDFAARQRTIRIYGRLALVLRRPAAFCRITGMP